jgi:RNA-binding protein
MPLSPQQKRLLKQRGQTLADGCQLGKARLTDEFIDHLNGLLDRDELVKMRFTDLEGSARKELAKAVCAAVDAECVQVVGRTVLMYRKNPKLKKKAKAKGRNAEAGG